MGPASRRFGDSLYDQRRLAEGDLPSQRQQQKASTQRDHLAALEGAIFHGLSYEYIVRALPKFAPEIAERRVVVAHLGNGASLCAIHHGRSVNTTMGLTGLDGLTIGTRCGAIDSGVLLYLIQAKQMDAAQIEDLIYRRSGLLGISELSSDMRALLASDDLQAALAIDYFVYRVVREFGAMVAALSGVDALVFTAGIGRRWVRGAGLAACCS